MTKTEPTNIEAAAPAAPVSNESATVKAIRAAWNENERTKWKNAALDRHQAIVAAAKAGKLPRNPHKGGTFKRNVDGSLTEVKRA